MSDHFSIPADAVMAGAEEIRKLNEHAWTHSDSEQYAKEAAAVLRAVVPGMIAAYLEGPLTAEFQRRADERAQIGDDDGEEDMCEEGGYDCHTAAAVATWQRARGIAKKWAAELRGVSS